jgi:chromosome segregation ATPase
MQINIDTEKIKGMIPDDKKTIILYAVLAICIIGGAWYLFGSESRNSNNVDARLSDLEKRLSDTQAEQRKTTAAIESAQRTTGAIRDIAESIQSGLANAQATVDRGAEKSNAARESISAARATVTECETVVIDSRAKIAECESIFGRIDQSNQERASSSQTKRINP